MAAPGTITHILEVAQDVAAAGAAHGASLTAVAAAATPVTLPGPVTGAGQSG